MTRHGRRAILLLCALGACVAAAVAGAATLGDGSSPPWRPYSDQSPFNLPVADDPTLLPESAEIVRRVTSPPDFGPPSSLIAGLEGTAGDFGHPTYFSSPGDPEVTLHCTKPWGRCELEGRTVRVPAEARPAAGDDGHMTIVDRASGEEYDLWQAEAPRDGVIDLSWGGITRLDGDGLGSDATAARFGNLAGIIRAEELEAGVIDHALFMTVRCDNGASVAPAQKSGARCSDEGLSDEHAPPMGAHFQLDMGEDEIAALPVAEWKRTIFRAMARYGMYVGDTGGGNWGIQVESDAGFTSLGRPAPFRAFAERSGFEPRLDPASGRTVLVGDFARDVDWASRLRVVAP